MSYTSHDFIRFMTTELGFKPDYVDGYNLGLKIRNYYVEICLITRITSEHYEGLQINICGIGGFKRWFINSLQVDKTKRQDINPGCKIIAYCGIHWYISEPTSQSVINMRNELMTAINREIDIHEQTHTSQNKELIELKQEITELKAQMKKLLKALPKVSA